MCRRTNIHVFKECKFHIQCATITWFSAHFLLHYSYRTITWHTHTQTEREREACVHTALTVYIFGRLTCEQIQTHKESPLTTNNVDCCVISKSHTHYYTPTHRHTIYNETYISIASVQYLNSFSISNIFTCQCTHTHTHPSLVWKQSSPPLLVTQTYHCHGNRTVHCTASMFVM